MTCNKNVGVG